MSTKIKFLQSSPPTDDSYEIRTYTDSTQWFKNGFRHRDDGPAIVWNNGEEEWYYRGRLQRIGAPAVIRNTGEKYWFFDGMFHRDDGGPAVIDCVGTQEWHVDGLCHRSDGPAIIHPDGDLEWYRYDKNITTEVNEWQHRLDIPHFHQWNDTHKTLYKVCFG